MYEKSNLISLCFCRRKRAEEEKENNAEGSTTASYYSGGGGGRDHHGHHHGGGGGGGGGHVSPGRSFYVHFTTATDAGSVRGCFGTVADMLKAEYAKGARYIHLTMFRYKKALNMVSLA